MMKYMKEQQMPWVAISYEGTTSEDFRKKYKCVELVFEISLQIHDCPSVCILQCCSCSPPQDSDPLRRSGKLFAFVHGTLF